MMAPTLHSMPDIRKSLAAIAVHFCRTVKSRCLMAAGEPLSHMMELMPHSMRRRPRQGGRGGAGGGGGGRQHSGIGSGRYAAVNMTGLDSSNGRSTPDDGGSRKACRDLINL